MSKQSNRSPVAGLLAAGLLVAAVIGAVPSSVPAAQAQVSASEAKLAVLDAPCVIHDSPTATGAGFSGPLAPASIRQLQVTGVIGADQGGTGECVPTTGVVTAVVLNVSAVNPSALGNLRVSEANVIAAGGVVNYQAGGPNNSNTITVPVSADGKIDVQANAGATDVRVSVLGYYSTTGTLSYTPLTPCAVSDSRDGLLSFAGPYGPGDAIPDIDVVGSFSSDQGGGNSDCGVPTGAAGVVVNLVALTPSGSSGSLAAGLEATTPTEGVTYLQAGQSNSATTMVKLGASGLFSLARLGTESTDVRVVVLGYLSTSAGKPYTPLNPCAVFDTRPNNGQGNPVGSFAGKRLAGTSGINTTGTTTYQISGTVSTDQGGVGSCGVPTSATGVLINLVAIDAAANGNFRAFATGSSPTGGVVNFGAGTPGTNSNAVVVPLNMDGEIDLFVNSPFNDGAATVHARGVVLGYYAPTQGTPMLAVGDLARCNHTADEEVSLLMDRLPDQPILGLGDLAYINGTITEFNTCFDPTFGHHKAQFLPVPGNHEYNTPNAAGYYEYFGAAAGDPTKGYYAQTRGDWLFLFLNSTCGAVGGCYPTSPQYLWLQAQLAAAPAGSCIAVTMHHPRWSSYVNYADAVYLSDFVNLLVSNQADVLFAGHSHHYERLAKVDGARQFSATGMRHFTAGTGSSLRNVDPGDVLAETEYWNDSNNGVLSMDFSDGEYSWQFINLDDVVLDSGTESCNN